jgi:transcription initiation factor TFIIA large subunit
VKQLIKDVKGKTKKSNVKLLQLDGEDDGEEGRVM